MSSKPCIKGSSISSLVEDLAKLRDAGSISEVLLEQHLTADDRALLDRGANLAGWYDVHSYRRLAELLCEVEGRRDDLLRERGAAAARRLAAAGIYQQMESVTRLKDVQQLDADARFQAYGRTLRLVATLSGSILNFGTWVVKPDPDHPDDRYCIEIQGGDAMPDVLAITTEGFVNAMAELGTSGATGRSDTWKLERRQGMLLFRMTRSPFRRSPDSK